MFKHYPVNSIDNERKVIIKKFNKEFLYKKNKIVHINCICCGSSKNSIIFNNEKYGINQKTVICEKCSFIYSNPRMCKKTLNYFYSSGIARDIYAVQVQNYKSKWERSKKFRRKKFYLKNYDTFDFINYIEDSKINYKTVFEIGAAGGANLRIFKSLKKKVMGNEPNSKLRKFARTKNIKIISPDIKSIPKNTDLIVLHHVLEHLFDPMETLKALKKRKVKYIYIGVPGIINLFPSLQIQHNFYFSPDTLIFLLNKAGFENVGYKFYNKNNYIVSIFKNSKFSKIYNFHKINELKKVKKIIFNFKVKSYFYFFASILKKLLKR